MSCDELTYEELHERYHDALKATTDALDENKELRNVLAKMSNFVNSHIPTLSKMSIDNCLEENQRLELSVETFRKYLQKTRGFTDEQITHIKKTGVDPDDLYDSTNKGYTTTWDKKKNLHDYMVTVLGYNQEQIMEIMESGAMNSDDPGVGYKFEHDFGKDDTERQVEMDFDNPDDGMVSESTDEDSPNRNPNNMLTRHVYAHMGYVK